MTAALIPRVQTLVVCDSVRPSRLEEGVFHLRGARCHVYIDAFPIRTRLRLFTILSSPRRGRFPGYVKVIDDHTDKAVFYGQIEPTLEFDVATDILPLFVPLNVNFPRAGRYTMQVWFFQEGFADVLKMEQSFRVLRSDA
jgi:hypothetical protein